MRFIYISFFNEMIHHSIAMIKRQNKNKKTFAYAYFDIFIGIRFSF
jgi:hypothetical protein